MNEKFANYKVYLLLPIAKRRQFKKMHQATQHRQDVTVVQPLLYNCKSAFQKRLAGETYSFCLLAECRCVRASRRTRAKYGGKSNEVAWQRWQIRSLSPYVFSPFKTLQGPQNLIDSGRKTNVEHHFAPNNRLMA